MVIIIKVLKNTHSSLTKLKNETGLKSYDEVIKRLIKGELQPKDKHNKSKNEISL